MLHLAFQIKCKHILLPDPKIKSFLAGGPGRMGSNGLSSV